MYKNIYQSITDSIFNNIEEIYINNDNDNKYDCDDNFLFKELVKDMTNTEDVKFDSNCLSVEMSVSVNQDEEYMIVDYKQDNINIVENYYQNEQESSSDNIESIYQLSDDSEPELLPNITIPDNNLDQLSGDSEPEQSPDFAVPDNDSDQLSDGNEPEQLLNIAISDNNLDHVFDDNEPKQSSDIAVSDQMSDNINNPANEIGLNKSNNKDMSASSISFFECFDDDVSINNAIACAKLPPNNNQLTTSYMFEAEDYKKSCDSFDDDMYEYEKARKPKNVIGRVGVIVVSAMMLFSGSAINKLF